MIVRQEPLSFFVDKLRRRETFSLARYGDGEIRCMMGMEGKTCDGCSYRPDLAMALLKSLTHTEPDFYYGLQRVLPRDAELLEEIIGGFVDAESKPLKTQWYDSGVVIHSIIDGEFYPFLEQLRQLDTVVISNADVREISDPHDYFDKFGAASERLDPILNYCHFIETPHSDTWLEKDRIIDEVLRLGKPACYLFSCGMTACVLVSELHGKVPGSWFIDMGHVWDAFIGKKTRTWMTLSHLASPEKIARNLTGG